jgi:hypothetical protein
MQPSRAIVTHLNGVFWLRNDGQQTRIPVEHITSQEKLSAWVEQQIGEKEVFYNYPDNLLPESEPTQTVIVAPSRKLEPPKPVYVQPIRSLAEEMALKAKNNTLPGKRSPRITLTCCNKKCGKQFERLLSHYEPSCSRVFCSRACQGEAAKKEHKAFLLNCSYCKMYFERDNVDNGSKLFFCTRECKHQHYRENPDNQQKFPSELEADKVA